MVYFFTSKINSRRKSKKSMASRESRKSVNFEDIEKKAKQRDSISWTDFVKGYMDMYGCSYSQALTACPAAWREYKEARGMPLNTPAEKRTPGSKLKTKYSKMLKNGEIDEETRDTIAKILSKKSRSKPRKRKRKEEDSSDDDDMANSSSDEDSKKKKKNKKRKKTHSGRGDLQINEKQMKKFLKEVSKAKKGKKEKEEVSSSSSDDDSSSSSSSSTKNFLKENPSDDNDFNQLDLSYLTQDMIE